MEEIYASRVTAVLAADAEFHGGSSLPSALDGDSHQLTDSANIGRLKRIVGQQLLFGVDRQRPESSRERPMVVWGGTARAPEGGRNFRRRRVMPPPGSPKGGRPRGPHPVAVS